MITCQPFPANSYWTGLYHSVWAFIWSRPTVLKHLQRTGYWGTGFHCSYLFRPHPVKLWVAAGRCLPRSLGWDRVSRHFKGTQVSSATRAVHVLLRLELDDRILWYKSIKVCVGRLSEALYLKWIWSSLSVYAGALECVPCHGDNLSGSECTWFQGQDVDKCFS